MDQKDIKKTAIAGLASGGYFISSVGVLQPQQQPMFNHLVIQFMTDMSFVDRVSIAKQLS